jgi:uncharacterized protein YkwD
LTPCAPPSATVDRRPQWDAFAAAASRYKTGMRLVVVVVAPVLALAPAAGAASATTAERALVACANAARAAHGLEPLKVDRALHSVADGDDGPVCVQDFGAKAGDWAR